MTDELAGQPLSAATTIKEDREQSRSPYQSANEDAAEEEEEVQRPRSAPVPRSSALSPTLPAPSPLPEDSPHKYGLKDRMSTPDLVAPPLEQAEKDQKAARRRSSGLEIFNSAARHHNHSHNHIHNHNHDIDGRRRGHVFKSNGFAFSRALNIMQLKCYRNHSRLLMSNNKHAPVECAVCHMDDDHEYWSCSWCAVRMCRYCRKDFAERGMTALRDRIRKAEMGADGSPSSSTESFSRERRRAYV
ncbi:hypothetical protein BAUCODRAFT_74112 [Baudoinia panamericana UAMH 10762]|uniref:Uncharacterized protein n=1 Tax=Baudoinia panamericana (strain UAMH 10762) TaxID=717646 RepID=M2N7H9_BAUPA|nr:uncharacterized protein BAUCODRAFT_74112 [Baudoinia panamericana UAMH 10762]EMC94765.1 hypothetical protein BAUCODRAFT_74112 [Baudoinia panamericana UAMH 10762]